MTRVTIKSVMRDVLDENPQGLCASRVVEEVLKRRAAVKNAVVSMLCHMVKDREVKKLPRRACCECGRNYTPYKAGLRHEQ